MGLSNGLMVTSPPCFCPPRCLSSQTLSGYRFINGLALRGARHSTRAYRGFKARDLMGSGNWNFLGLGLALTVSALGAGLAMAEPVKVPPEAFAPAALSSKPLTTAGDAVKTPVESPKAAAQRAAKPAAKPTAKPVAKPVAEPAAKLAAKPRAQPP